MSAAHDDPTFRKNRARILKDKPLCVWCQEAPATTADHLIEVDLGGGHELSNLVPACKPCNSRRGAQYVNRKRAGYRGKGEPITHSTPGSVLGATDPHPEMPLGGRSLGGVGSEPMEADDDGMLGIGRVAPRLVTPDPGGPSYGPAVAAWSARVLGVELMEWQQLALEGQLRYSDMDGAGYGLRHRLSLVSTARQNGKTTAVRPLIGWYLTELAQLRRQPVTVITTSIDLKQCEETFFLPLAPILEDHFGGKAKWSHGRCEMTMPDGSRWLIQSATSRAGHGYSPDLVVADEVWRISEEAIEQGLIPAQRARKSPLLSMWSTAGTDSSEVMLRFREEALRNIDADRPGRIYMAEWSPPPGVDPLEDGGVRWARWANPALGTTIDLDTIQAEAQSPNRAAFLRASLNLWISSEDSWIPPGRWDTLQIDPPAELPAGGVLAVERSLDESTYVGLHAVAVERGRVHVRVAFVCQSLADTWRHVADMMTDRKTQLVVTPDLRISLPPDLEARTNTVGHIEIKKWTTTVHSMILEGRLSHAGEAMLAEHVSRAVATKQNGSLALSSYKSPGPIELARCLVWASALAAKPVRTGRPAMARSRA